MPIAAQHLVVGEFLDPQDDVAEVAANGAGSAVERAARDRLDLVGRGRRSEARASPRHRGESRGARQGCPTRRALP